MNKATPSAPAANPFVIAAFAFMWVVAFYPLMASLVASYSPLGAIILLVTLPLFMAAILYPLWNKYGDE